MAEPKTTLERLLAGAKSRPLIGTNLICGGPEWVELCGNAGFDFVCVDQMISPMSWEATSEIRGCIERGATVVAVDNFITGAKENVSHLDGYPRFTLVELDLVNGLPDDVEALQGRFDAILQLASPASPTDFRRLAALQPVLRRLTILPWRLTSFLSSSTSL